ncbi:MAG: DUF1573 domain-containing protein [Planctomycetales bacterium]
MMFSSCAQEPDRVGPPLIHFASLEIDLGEVTVSSEPLEVEFPFENRGLALLRIDRVVSHCGCAGAKCEVSELAPEATGKVVAAIHPNQSEERSTAVTVYTNDPLHPTVALHFRWKAVAPIDLSPSRVDLGVIRPNQVRSTYVAVSRPAGGVGCVIKEIVPHPKAELAAELEPPTQESGGSTSQRLALTVTGGRTSGVQTGSILLELDGCWTPQIYLPVTWRIADIIELLPERVFLGVGAPGETNERVCRLTSLPGEFLVVDSVERQGEAADEVGLESTINSVDSNTVEIRIQWLVPEELGLHTAVLRVNCSAPEEREIEVPVSVFSRRPSN